MDDRIKTALSLIDEWENNQSPSGQNDINVIYSIKEILNETPSEDPDQGAETSSPGM